MRAVSRTQDARYLFSNFIEAVRKKDGMLVQDSHMFSLGRLNRRNYIPSNCQEAYKNVVFFWQQKKSKPGL